MPLVTTPTIALVGNPNTGKTTLFNALAGLRQRVGNYPGVTVETKKGHFRHAEQSFSVIDLPGTYSLAPRSPDEMVAVDVILGKQGGEARPDVVVTIVDASNLERNLYLTTQVLDLGVPVVVALNMTDVAGAQGITIDPDKLSEQMGVPVVAIQANKGRGLRELKHAIRRAIGSEPPQNTVPFPDVFEKAAADLADIVGPVVPPYLLRRLLLDVGGFTERHLTETYGHELAEQIQAARQKLAAAGCSVPAAEAKARYGWIRRVTADCVRRPSQRPLTWTDRFDHVLTHRIWGTLIFLALMFLVFQSIFTFARPLMDWIDRGKDAVADMVESAMAPGPLRALIIDGVFKGVGSVLMFLPQILILFAFIAVLEDCGYMARAAFLMDKLMSRCGLSGKSFIPLLSSMACAVPGILSARVIENKRDRFATILVAPLMSCSARIPVYSLLIAAFLSESQGYPWWVAGMTLFCLYLLGLIVAPLMAWVLKRTLLRGETPVFVMEMPLYKVPSLRTVLQRMSDAGIMFVRRAGTIILASMILVWSLLYFPFTAPDGSSYDQRIAELNENIKDERKELKALEDGPGSDEAHEKTEALEKKIALLEKESNSLRRDWQGQSWLGRAGKYLEPAVRPLGWDWRVGMAALASFPAREVFVGTMGIIYSQGEGKSDDAEYREGVGDALRGQNWDDDASRKVFSVPVALSVMVFFALCCQCASTLAVIRRETNSWLWPIFTFIYMTTLAYLGALVVYQVSSLVVA
jgi:ferrous iron transport protein B